MKYQQIILLLLAVSFVVQNGLFGQRVNSRFPMLKYYDFSFSGTPDSVDCRFNEQTNELFLSGFDTDGQGTFYFAGGCPLRVSCFKGAKLQWRKTLSDSYTARALFRLRDNDSLYLINDRACEMYIMHKNGNGEIRKVPLLVDTIYSGVMHKNYFVLSKYLPRVVQADTIFHDKQVVCYFNYVPQLAWSDTLKDESATYCELKMKVSPQYGVKKQLPHDCPYKGTYKGKNIFFSIGGESRVYFTDSFDNVLGAFSMLEKEYYDVFPLPVLCDEIDKEVHVSNQDMEILRGSCIYAVGFEGQKRRLVVSEFNLDMVLQALQ